MRGCLPLDKFFQIMSMKWDWQDVFFTVCLAVKPTIIPGQRRFALYQNRSLTYSFGLQSPIYPDPAANDIAWTGPSGVIQNSSKQLFTGDARSMTISDLQRPDAGDYIVTVTNAAGVDSTQFSVEVYGKTQQIVTASLFGTKQLFFFLHQEPNQTINVLSVSPIWISCLSLQFHQSFSSRPTMRSISAMRQAHSLLSAKPLAGLSHWLCGLTA